MGIARHCTGHAAEGAEHTLIVIVSRGYVLPNLHDAGVILQRVCKLGEPLGCDLVLDEPERRTYLLYQTHSTERNLPPSLGGNCNGVVG